MAYGFQPFSSGTHLVRSLPHDEMVCAVAINNKHVYAGGKGNVKFWDLTKEESNNSERQLQCLESNDYVHSVKLSTDKKKLFVAGQSSVCIWDLATDERIDCDWILIDTECHALAISPDSNLLFCCVGNGNIEVYEHHNKLLVHTFLGHNDIASCVDISPDGRKLFTGGLDKAVKIWDCRNFASEYIWTDNIYSQILSLGAGPTAKLAVAKKIPDVFGFRSRQEETNLFVYDTSPSNLEASSKGACTLSQHTSDVTSLKFAPSMSWFVSTGKDKRFIAHKMPGLLTRFEGEESAPILCCDISADEKCIVTGSEDKKVSVYEVEFDSEFPFRNNF